MGDSDPIQDLCFSNLEKRQKSLEDQFQDLLKHSREIKFPNVEPREKRNRSDRKVKEFSVISKQIQESQKQLLNEHKEHTEDLRQMNRKVKELNKSLLHLEEGLVPSEEASKPVEKALMQAIKKYSEKLNMHIVDVKTVDDDTFVACVTFSSKRNSKSVDLVIDRKQRCVLDFNASSLISDEEAFKLKAEAMSEVGLDIDVVLAKLRKLCI